MWPETLPVPSYSPAFFYLAFWIWTHICLGYCHFLSPCISKSTSSYPSCIYLSHFWSPNILLYYCYYYYYYCIIIIVSYVLSSWCCRFGGSGIESLPGLLNPPRTRHMSHWLCIPSAQDNTFHIVVIQCMSVEWELNEYLWVTIQFF